MEDKLKELEEQLQALQTQRITQAQILPDAVKMRHVGEGVRFVRSGLDADKPAKGEDPLQGSALYFATDTKKLYIWTGSAWVSVTLS